MKTPSAGDPPGGGAPAVGARPHAPRLALVGFDALDIDFVRAHLDDLPTLRALFDEEEPAPLASPADLLTSAVWPTFSTGGGPGQHGVYYPFQWDPQEMRLRRVTAEWLAFEPFWGDLDRDGVAVTAFDVPFRLPIRMERGVEVQNWGSQECLGPFGASNPALARALRRRFGDHPMGSEVPLEQPTEKLRALRDRLVEGARRKAEAACWLLDETRPDLFVCVFAECHRAGHVLWPEQGPRRTPVPDDALLDVYRALDDALGRLLRRLDPERTPVIVFSPHGMGPNRTQEHLVLEVVNRLNALFLGDAQRFEEEPKGGGGLVALARRLVPPSFQTLLARALPPAVRDWVVARTFLGAVDFARTPGFALPHSGEGYLRFNLAGREARGLLTADDPRLADYARAVEEAFLSLEDAASGRNLAAEVACPAERWTGPRAHLLPDRVVLWRGEPPTERAVGGRLGVFEGRLGTGRTGEHRPVGFTLPVDPKGRLADAPEPRELSAFASVARALVGASVP